MNRPNRVQVLRLHNSAEQSFKQFLGNYCAGIGADFESRGDASHGSPTEKRY